MTTIDVKRARSHKSGNVTSVCTLKDVGVNLMGLNRMMATYGYGGKRQGRTDDTCSYHQPIVLCTGAGSTSCLERRYSSTTISEERDHENGSDMDEEYLTELGRASVGVSTTLTSLPLPFITYTTENDALAGHQAHSPIAPLVPGDTSVCFSYDFGSRQSFDSSPKQCSFIPSFRRSAASEAELACPSPGSEYFIPQAEYFQWDFPDPFNAPTTDLMCTFAMARDAKMHIRDNIAPHMEYSKFGEHPPFANLPPPPPPSPLDHVTKSITDSGFQTPVARLSLGAVGGGTQLGSFQPTSIPSRPASPGDGYDTCASRSSSTASDDTCSFVLLRADLEYVNAMLRAQEAREAKEAIAEEIRERENRARLRSQSNKEDRHAW